MVKTISLGMVKVFLIQEDMNILVDTGIPGSAPKILAGLKENGVSPDQISLILLTHGHSDHTGSAKALKDATGAPVAIGRADADALRTGTSQRVTALSWLGKALLRVLMMNPPKLAPVEPDIVIDGEMSLENYGVKGRIISTPGHTDGSVSVILESGEAIVGDLVAGKSRKPSLPPFGESAEAIKQSVCEICKPPITRIYAAHGGPFEVEAVKKRFCS